METVTELLDRIPLSSSEIARRTGIYQSTVSRLRNRKALDIVSRFYIKLKLLADEFPVDGDGTAA